MIRALAIAALTALGGCAGLPVARHVYLVAGLAIVRVDPADRATAIRVAGVGASFGCGQLTLGVARSYCAALPIDGDVAVVWPSRLTLSYPKDPTP